MALAINANSVAKGIDPRNFSLMGFGGAGPLHSVSLAEAIFAKDVISPVQPGITAATGLLVTDLQYEYTHSTLLVLDKASEDEFGRVNAVLDELIARANRQLDADGIPRQAARLPPGRRMPLCRTGLRAARRNAGRPARQGHGGGGHREFLRRPQAGLWPRLPRPVLRDRDAARHRDGGGRHAEAAEARQGRAAATRPMPCSISRRTVFDDGKALETPRYQRGKLLADDRSPARR